MRKSVPMGQPLRLVWYGVALGACSLTSGLDDVSAQYGAAMITPTSGGGTNGKGGLSQNEGGAGASSVETGGAGGSAEDTCPPTPDQAVVYVHADQGDDFRNDGTCEKPFRSISKALKVAAPLGEVIITTIHVAGGPVGSPPLEYSEAKTGEQLPLVFPRPNLRLVGPAKERVVIRGSGTGTSIGCTVDINQPNTELRGLTLQDSRDYCVFLNAQATTFADINITTCAQAGILMGAGTLTLSGSTISDTASCGVNLNSQAKITLRNSTVTDCRGPGICAIQDVTIDSANSVYTKNRNGPGISVVDQVKVTSVSDTFSQNQTGLTTRGQGAVNLTGAQFTSNSQSGLVVSSEASCDVSVTNSTFSNNMQHGIFLANNAKHVTVRGSQFLQNLGNGVLINEPDTAATAVDLGRSGSPGGNVFGANASANQLAGVCNNGQQVIPARGNQWAMCPPNTTSSCTGGVPLGGAQAVDTGDCTAP